MNITCGTDIIEVNRIQDAIETMGEKFLNRIYTEKEIAYCESKKTQKFQHYAGRFAAKEAIFKAISKELNDKYSIEWIELEVLNNKQGRPIVKIKADKLLKQIKSVDISISHCKEYATANVIVEWEK